MEISLHLQEHSCEPAAYSSPPPVLLHSLAQHRSSPSGLAQVAARVSTAPRHVSVACKPRERRVRTVYAAATAPEHVKHGGRDISDVLCSTASMPRRFACKRISMSNGCRRYLGATTFPPLNGVVCGDP